MDNLMQLQEDMRTVAAGGPAVIENTDSDVLFDGGPTIAELNQWKSQYSRVCLTGFDDGSTYIWRTMTRVQWKKATESIVGADQATFEEMMLQKVLLWPKLSRENVMNLPAGVPTTILDQCVKAMGFAALPAVDL